MSILNTFQVVKLPLVHIWVEMDINVFLEIPFQKLQFMKALPLCLIPWKGLFEVAMSTIKYFMVVRTRYQQGVLLSTLTRPRFSTVGQITRYRSRF